MNSHKLVVERAALVDGVEGFGLLAAHPDALLGDDAQARLLQLGVDLAGEVPPGGIRLDHGKRTLDGHRRSCFLGFG
jgi:hypothetical protein